MKITDYLKYIRSLFKDEIPALGYLYRKDKYGNVAELVPLYSLLYDDWRFIPLANHRSHAKEIMGGVRSLVSDNVVTEFIDKNSIDRIEDMYKVLACNNEDNISLEVAGALYNLTHGDKWEELEPYQRSTYISNLADHIAKNREADKSSVKDVPDDTVDIINGKLNARSSKVLCKLIKEAIPSIVFSLSGSPIFIENSGNRVWNYTVTRG